MSIGYMSRSKAIEFLCNKTMENWGEPTMEDIMVFIRMGVKGYEQYSKVDLEIALAGHGIRVAVVEKDVYDNKGNSIWDNLGDEVVDLDEVNEHVEVSYDDLDDEHTFGPDDVITLTTLVDETFTMVPAGTKCTIMDMSAEEVTLQVDDTGTEIKLDMTIRDDMELSDIVRFLAEEE